MGIPNIEDTLISLHNDFETNDKLQDKVYELEQQLQAYKAKEKELREYITSYESISIIQGLDNISKNKDLDGKTMIEMTNRYLEVHDKILDILDKE